MTTESDKETKIVYVPGAKNHYKYGYDVVVLDERLKDYPKAHKRIKNHELEHAKHDKPENRRFLDLIRLEFQTDLEHYLSNSNEMKEVREYFEERGESKTLQAATAMKFSFADLLREFWTAVFRPLGWAYRQAKSLRGRAGR